MVDSVLNRSAGGPALRLETLIRIRWLAVIGQTVAVLLVAHFLRYDFYLSLCLALIAASAWLNVFLRLRYRASFRLTEVAAVALLGYDILQLAMLLFLTGGLQNPFSMLLIVPVIVSATTQSIRQILPLAILAVGAASALVFFHLPLPWEDGASLQLPLAYVSGMWVAIFSMMVFTAVYTYRVADEARQLSAALAATELVLQREQHLSTLDGLAAAAAHELGTPLATIALVSKEMIRELPQGSPLSEDAQLLRGQAERCRQILGKLTSLSEAGDDLIGRVPLSSVMEEVAAPHRDFGIELVVTPGSIAGEPKCMRNPAILYGLGNLVENAIDFAASRVEFTGNWDDQAITITIADDGPGFPPDLIERIGEPYVTTRRRDTRQTGGGLGLGLFIAKTLLERAGASIEFANAETGGAIVTVRWPRAMADTSNTVVPAEIPDELAASS
ncbi:MAG: ActS/PrrB/RegB family redox-sensitive histidine kinase [Salaquimonas sp.]|jgi:two-component system sensor histidine kinase RegB|nr:ActS/PrrB/RegB family redox-sensitive histidine kinase [Salaquimonas sp.]